MHDAMPPTLDLRGTFWGYGDTGDGMPKASADEATEGGTADILDLQTECFSNWL